MSGFRGESLGLGVTDDTLHKIKFCNPLYKAKWLFPSRPEQGTVFYPVLLALSILIILYCLLRIRRQRQLLAMGEIKAMKEWLLPVYHSFLWFCIIVYAVKAIDILITYLFYRSQFQSDMPTWIAIIHAASFWASEFWLFDAIVFFLASNSHGYKTIRRACWISTVLWIANTAVITAGIRNSHQSGFLNFTVVYAIQCVLTLCCITYMLIRRYPHHRYMWLLLSVFFVETLLRFISDYLRYRKYDAYCFMDIGDYISSLLIPWLLIYTMRCDSQHWSHLSTAMLGANRGSIYNTFSMMVMGHERQSMTVWSELLSQHTRILKSDMLIPIHDHRRMIGGSGRVTKARYKGEIVAVKEWRFEHFTKHVIALWCKEALISSNFRHRNVVKLIGICMEPPSIKIVMEWCRHGSLRKMLISRRNMSWKLRYQFILDIAEGMAHLHRNGLVHRDLKTLNLLVDSDRKGHYVIRICDFGSSRSVNFDEYYQTHASQLSFASSFTNDTLGNNTMNTQGYTTEQHSRVGSNSGVSGIHSSGQGANSSGLFSGTQPYNYRPSTPLTITGANPAQSYTNNITPASQDHVIAVSSTTSALASSKSKSKAATNHMRYASPRGISFTKNHVLSKKLLTPSEKQLKLEKTSITSVEHPLTSTTTTTTSKVSTLPKSKRHGEEELVGSLSGAYPSRSDRWQSSSGMDEERDRIFDDLIGMPPSAAEMGAEDLSLTSVLLHEIATNMSTIVGSVQFLAPEILQNIEFKPNSRQARSKNNSVYGFSADVYSFGCVLWEIITRREIYKGQPYADIQKFVLSGQRPAVLESEVTDCPDSQFLLRLMDFCWAGDPNQRPNFPQIIAMLEDKKETFIPSRRDRT